MTLQQLEYALAIDTHKHFGKAAEACFVTQATLSAMIKKLEDELQIMLFDRRAHPIVTTDAGQEILDEARKILAHSRLLLEKANSINDQISGRITVGIIPTVASSLLPLILPTLLKNYPSLQIHVKEYKTSTIISKLKSGDLDLAILAPPMHEEGLDIVHLYYEGLTAYGTIKSLGHNKPIAPIQIEGEKIWLLDEGHCLRTQSLKLCELALNNSKGLEQLTFEASSFDTLMHMVDSFGGVTFIPELYHNFLSQEQQEKIYTFQSPKPVRQIAVVAYRPFAKQRIIKKISNDIQNLVLPKLKTKQDLGEEIQMIGI